MPYLAVQTNLELPADKVKNFVNSASKLIASALSKPERYVMVELNVGLSMSFAGSDAPLAYVELKNIGLSPGALGSLSAKISEFLEAELQIAPDRVYIEFTNINGSYWGFNKGTF